MKQKSLIKEEVMNMNVSQSAKNLYLDAMSQGADIIILNETPDGYDIGMVFSPITKH